MSIVWCDLETTGLDPASHLILEIAVVVTDDDLNVIDYESSIVSCPSARGGMSPAVAEMHRRSGLLADIDSTPWAPDLEASSLAGHFARFVTGHGAQEAPLAGSSVGFDRAFLKAQMPEFERHLSYRTIDVSSFKEMVARWHPEVPAWEKQGGHRALGDILDSIAELKYYRARFFQ